MNLERRVFLVENEPKPPSENLAANRIYLDLVKKGDYDLIGRVYTHNKGLILGRNESLDDVDEEFCNLHHYEIVERPSGGSVVVVNNDLVLCYSIFFNWEKFNLGKDTTKIYKAITIPLAKRLGDNISVEGIYYLRANVNGLKIPFAGHAIRIEKNVVQFDGLVNKTRFDVDFLSRLLKLRKLYSYNGDSYILVGEKAYNLDGERVYNFDFDKAELVREEKKELEKILGLKELGIDERHFIEALFITLNEVFGITEKKDKLEIEKEKLKKIAEKIKENSRGGRKGVLGHCFIDLAKPEPKIHYGICV